MDGDEPDARDFLHEEDDHSTILGAGAQPVPFGFEAIGEYELLMKERRIRDELRHESQLGDEGPTGHNVADHNGRMVPGEDSGSDTAEEFLQDDQGSQLHGAAGVVGELVADGGEEDANVDAVRVLSTQVWGERYWENQVDGRCGQHALNNMLGGPQYDADNFKTAVAEILLEIGGTEHDHMNKHGWYSHSALSAMLQNSVPPMWRVSVRRATAASWVQLKHEDTALGALINLNNEHWVSVCKDSGFVFYCDSKYAPHIIDVDDWEAILLRFPDTSLVVAHDSEWDL
jgi:hypothetical protein